MSLKISELISRLRGEVNILMVDDQPQILATLLDTFSSPLFNKVSAHNAKEANTQLSTARKPWHCWICDIAMEEPDSGLKLVKAHPEFPFVVMLSGLQSMGIASEATRAGVLRVFDKGPNNIETIQTTVCKISALGYLLSGKQTQYLPMFLLLIDNNFDTPQAWAEKACMTVRQLERICELHSTLSPRNLIPFFYCLSALLMSDDDALARSGDELDKLQLPSPAYFYRNSIENVLRKADIVIESISGLTA